MGQGFNIRRFYQYTRLIVSLPSFVYPTLICMAFVALFSFSDVKMALYFGVIPIIVCPFKFNMDRCTSILTPATTLEKFYAITLALIIFMAIIITTTMLTALIVKGDGIITVWQTLSAGISTPWLLFILFGAPLSLICKFTNNISLPSLLVCIIAVTALTMPNERNGILNIILSILCIVSWVTAYITFKKRIALNNI